MHPKMVNHSVNQFSLKVISINRMTYSFKLTKELLNILQPVTLQICQQTINTVYCSLTLIFSEIHIKMTYQIPCTVQAVMFLFTTHLCCDAA